MLMTKLERVLSVLEVLQDRGTVTGPQLAARLGVDVRTVRRDVAALKELGIPVEAARGPAGGYRLQPGYRMPPLMLTGAEATAVALGLIAARRDGLDADGALAKIRRVLPDRVRVRVEALEHTVRFTGGTPPGPAPPKGENLLLIADAARRGRRVHSVYAKADGTESERELSPYGVVSHAGRWYVPAFDHGRGGPRLLRADRFCTVRLGGPAAPAPPGFDPVAFVTASLARVPWTHEVEVVMHTTMDEVRRRFGPATAELEPAGEHETVLRMRAESLDWVAGLLAAAGCEFEVRSPDELRERIHALADRLRAV
jgi:predicted DNA-binding transcriptional regulator YafY